MQQQNIVAQGQWNADCGKNPCYGIELKRGDEIKFEPAGEAQREKNSQQNYAGDKAAGKSGSDKALSLSFGVALIVQAREPGGELQINQNKKERSENKNDVQIPEFLLAENAGIQRHHDDADRPLKQVQNAIKGNIAGKRLDAHLASVPAVCLGANG